MCKSWVCEAILKFMGKNLLHSMFGIHIGLLKFNRFLDQHAFLPCIIKQNCKQNENKQMSCF